MATIAAQRVKTPWDGTIALWKWEALGDGDEGAPVAVPQLGDVTVQVGRVAGDFGTGGQVDMEGTLHPTSPAFAVLNDPQGNALSFTAPKIEAVLENVYQIRPKHAAGTGVGVDVYMLVK